MFDISTKEFDFSNVPATPIDILDMIEYYDTHNPMYQILYDANEAIENRRMKKRERFGYDPMILPIFSYDLVEFFVEDSIRKKPESHFIVDEVPIVEEGKNFKNLNFLPFLYIYFSSTSLVFSQ